MANRNLVEPTILITGEDSQGLLVQEGSVSCNNNSGVLNEHLRTAIVELLQVKARDSSERLCAKLRVPQWSSKTFHLMDARVILTP